MIDETYQKVFNNLVVLFVIVSIITTYSQDCNTSKLKDRIEKLERKDCK